MPRPFHHDPGINAMSTAVARIDELTPDRVALLKRTLCPDLTNDEMELFASVARRVQLDPFAKQIYAIKRKGKLTIQTGIDGFRVVAARTSELDGQEGPFWCGEDGVWRDVWVDGKNPPVAAKVVVYRRGCRFGFVGIAKFWEYAQTFQNGDLMDMWARMGANQIAKCAEALALRKAFPADLSGLYTTDEMEQVEPPEAAATTQAEPVKQLPPAPKHSPDADGIDRTADRAAKAAREQKLGDPMNDSAAILILAQRKGWDWAGLVKSINDKFKTTYGLTKTPWRDMAKDHREKAIACLRALPDKDSADELTRLLSRVASAERSQPAAVFQRYQVAAGLPESCIAPADLDAAQLVKACASFRAKLDGLADDSNGE